MSSTSNSDSEDDVQIRGKKRKYTNKQKMFQHSWLEDPTLKAWLKPSKESAFYCRCCVCNVRLQCGKSELVKHSQTVKHVKNIKNIKETPKIEAFLKSKESSQDLDLKIKSAEIALSAFFAEHNVALMTVEHLVPLLQKILPDSRILQGITLGTTKCTEIVRNILEPVETEELIKILKESNFSILLDESTDISSKKSLCILARHFYNGEVKTRPLELLEIDAKDCSAEKLYTEFTTCMGKKGIPLKNIVGVASDGAAVMIGKNNSFFSKLKQDVPHVILLRCVCHTSVIISSKACAELPRTPEDMIRNIATYISGSAKRCAELLEFQEYFNCAKKKLLKLANTRWLSLHKCVERILENWDVLSNFFQLAAAEDHLKSAASILEDMKNPLNKAFLLFLFYVLNYFNTFNALFQGRNILIQDLHQKSLCILSQISQNFIKPHLLNGISSLNPTNPYNFLPLEEINLGYKCNLYIKENLSMELQNEVRKRCLRFYIVAVEEMQKRLPIEDFFKELQMLIPKFALSVNNNNIHNVFPTICTQYEIYVDLHKLQFEWQSLPFAFPENEINILMEHEVGKFWAYIHKCMDGNNDPKFPELTKLTKILLVMPHSNAESERVFSIVTDCKPKKRNRLGAQTLNAMAVYRSSMQAKNLNCCTFNVGPDHIKKHAKSMYSFIKK